MIKLDIEYHFLDSNIFLGKVLSDSSTIYDNYFKKNYTKITSKTVEMETKSVVHKLRVISLTILKYINNYVAENNIPDNNIYDNIKIMEKKFKYKYNNKKYPFGFKKEKFNSLTHELFSQYSNFIKNGIYLKPLNILIEWQYNEISISYRKSFNSLENLFKKIEIYSFDKTSYNKRIKKHLNTNIHNSDAEILLDAFNTSEILEDYLFFITKDKEILNNSDIILSLLNNRVIPKKPEDFICN